MALYKGLEKEFWVNEPALAYYSGYGGVEIKRVYHGFNKYVIVVSNAWYGKPSVHKVKVYDGFKPFFIVDKHRIYLEECISELTI